MELFLLEHRKLWRRAGTKISVCVCFLYLVVFGSILSFQWFNFGSKVDFKSNDFEKKFDEANLEVKGSLPNNKEKPEYFEHVNGDENYVEGRWAGANHQEMVGDIGLNANEIAIIKYGAIYPDVAWPGKGKNSPWHGRWQYLSNSNNDNYRLGTNINYAAVVDVVTSIALKGGNTSTFTNYAKYKGMDSKLI